MCRGEIFDESGSGNNGISRGRVIVEAGYNQDNGVDLSDGFIQLDGMNFKVWYCALVSVSNRPRSNRVHSWARHVTFTVPLSTLMYKPMLGVILRWTSIPSRGEVEILLAASC